MIKLMRLFATRSKRATKWKLFPGKALYGNYFFSKNIWLTNIIINLKLSLCSTHMYSNKWT